MNRTELSEALAEGTSLSKQQAKEALNALLSIIAETVTEGESVTLKNFGNFTLQKRAERYGRNPKTGERINIPAKNVIKFTPAKGLSEEVSN